MALKAVYVTQYGAWWRLTPEQWQACCESGVKGEGYLLPPAAMLKRRPQTVGVTDYGSDRPSYWLNADDYLLYQPLDWEPDDFADALQQLAQKRKKR